MDDRYGMAGEYPPPPWQPGVEPEAGDVADWLRGMTRDQAVAALTRQRTTWQQESECFQRDHEGRIADYGQQMDTVHADLVTILAELGIGDHARPYSSHEAIHREVVPAIRRLTAKSSYPLLPDPNYVTSQEDE